ncbi:hypothetical protein GCM10010483_57680 [Actinokineospora diospyrosa]
MAPLDPRVHGLSRWAEADLTGGELAPLSPSVQVLRGWVGAHLTGGKVGTDGSECPGAG